jgi:predicted dehydrogenase
VCALIDTDPVLGVDRLASMMLDFPGGQAVGTCSMQMAAGQGVMIAGTRGRIEIEIPFNAPPDRACRMFVDDGKAREPMTLEVCDQYTIQGDLFAQAVRRGRPVAYPLEDSVKNLRVLDALVRSGASGAWQEVAGSPS